MKYQIITYGCQMNKSDSERIAKVLEETGYQLALNEKEADLILVNACSVRQSAIDRIWGQTQRFAKLKMQNEKLKTILTGCLLKEDRKKFLQKFDLILDIKDLVSWPQKLSKSKIIPQKDDRSFGALDYLKIIPKYQSPFSAFIPIMTGCNNFCTFCVVPYTRGREISRPVEEILCETESLIKRGFKEIWFLGQNVNSYSYKQETVNGEQKINFPQLLKMINDIPGDFWIRFTSSHPKDFSEELINTIANCKKITEYLNLPVQSGDNDILKKMNRPYTIEQYKEIVRKIKERVPKISLSTDIIVGFPGETEKQFQNTVELFKEIKFDMAYIAKFSPRPGTKAAELKDNVPPKEKERRWKILTRILEKTALEKNKKYIGEIIPVLAEEEKRGFLFGKTRNYKTVQFKGDSNLIGQFVQVKISNAFSWGLKGKIKNET